MASDMGGHLPLEWSQTDSEVIVQIALGGHVEKDKVKAKIEAAKILVTIAGKMVLESELTNKIIPDESYWALEGSGDERCVVLTLAKKKHTQWRALTREDEKELPEKDALDADFDVLALEHDDDEPERVEEQEENERRLEARYKMLVSEKGLEHEDTLVTFFALFDNCIQLYRLNKLSEYLEEVVPACRKRTDKYKLKAIQALAFVRWKQSKFREALPLFHEMEDILGKGAALCENIAHTYNSLGDYEQAEDYFRQALKFVEQEHGQNQGNRGGVLLGLGLVRDRLGRHKDALPVCRKAYEFYKDRANGAPASLQAKAGISCAKIHVKLGQLPIAENYITEAVAMYEVTCGPESPLTASAYHELGEVLWKQRKRTEAQKALKRAYEIESIKDAWDLVTLLEIHNLLMETHLKECNHIDREKFKGYFKIIEFVEGRVRRQLPQDGNAAVYYKAAAEMKAWGGYYQQAKDLFDDAMLLFEAEKSTDCSGLLQTCRDMYAFCERNLAGTQCSPMGFDIPAERGSSRIEGCTESGTGGIEESTVTVEEVFEDAIEPSDEMVECRAMVAADHAVIVQLCADNSTTPLLDEGAFARHLASAGANLCWMAERGSEPKGFSLCGSDGVFGQLLQLVGDGEVQHALAECSVDATLKKGLRTLRAVVPEKNAMFLEELGWRASHVYSYPTDFHSLQNKCHVEQDNDATEPDTTQSAKTARATPILNTSQKYETWDKLDIERVLIAEDGGDPSVVPKRPVASDDFGILLDSAAKIADFAWDQSSRFVSIYVTFEKLKDLVKDAVTCLFRARSLLLLIQIPAGKTHWFKVPNLCQDIDVDMSKWTVKTTSVSIKLRKAQEGRTWSDLTDEKDIYQQRREYRLNHGDLKDASTEKLIEDMYQNANDEDREGLRNAMRINREKRAEDARRAARR